MLLTKIRNMANLTGLVILSLLMIPIAVALWLCFIAVEINYWFAQKLNNLVIR